ncbi:hypothetical protein ABZP12_03975 [Xanthomonas euvesicatoria]
MERGRNGGHAAWQGRRCACVRNGRWNALKWSLRDAGGRRLRRVKSIDKAVRRYGKEVRQFVGAAQLFE